MPGPQGPANRGWLVTGIRLIHIIAAARAERHGGFKFLVMIIITSDQSNHRRTRTVQSYSPGETTVHPHLVHPNRHLHCTCVAPCLVPLSILTTRYALASPKPASFGPQNCPFTCGDLDCHLIRVSLDSPESITQMASRSVEPFLQGSRSYLQTDRLTDRPRYFVCNNKPHLIRAAM